MLVSKHNSTPGAFLIIINIGINPKRVVNLTLLNSNILVSLTQHVSFVTIKAHKLFVIN